jgi:hypothetical protein
MVNPIRSNDVVAQAPTRCFGGSVTIEERIPESAAVPIMRGLQTALEFADFEMKFSTVFRD